MRSPATPLKIWNVHLGGGGGAGGGRGVVTQERFSNFDNDRSFKQRNCRKTLSVRKNFISTLSQTSRLNLDKFGIGNEIPDCRSRIDTCSYKL